MGLDASYDNISEVLSTLVKEYYNCYKHLSVFCLLNIHQVFLFTFLDIHAPHLFDIQIVKKVLFFKVLF
jgi:hypothetical protein